MARTKDRLSASKLSTTKPGRYADGGNLYLQVTVPKTKEDERRKKGKEKRKAPFRSWVFIYKERNSGKYRMMGLGKAGPRDVTLAEARQRAAKQRALLRDGKDPLEVKQAALDEQRAASANAVKFKDFADNYISTHRESWKGGNHARQWEQSLRKYAYPIIGNLDVASITVDDVLKVIEPIWTKRTETASRLRGRIENILGAAKVRKLRTGDNPAAWTENLEELLPSANEIKVVKHHPALPYADMPQFFKELRERDGISARALEFLILNASRTSEVIRATWPEIDFDEKQWTIPKERMKIAKSKLKKRRNHVVPLSDTAVALLKRLPREEGNPYLFIGGKEGEPLSNMAMLELVKEMRPGITVHGFRSTFRDWAAEETPHANIVVEMALAHVIGDRTEAAYRRGDLLKKRRRLMADWARYCGQLEAQSDGKVTPFRVRKSS